MISNMEEIKPEIVQKILEVAKALEESNRRGEANYILFPDGTEYKKEQENG